MNVLFTSYHGCIRVYKEAVAVLKTGTGIHFLTRTFANGDCVKTALPSLNFFLDDIQYVDKLKMFRGMPIIHVHNEPDWLVYLAKDTRPDAKIVFDVHDLQSMHTEDGKPDDDEQRAMQVADGFIFQSDEFRNEAIRRHPGTEHKPYTIIRSMCSEDHIVNNPLPRTRGIVYEGGVSLDENGGRHDRQTYPNRYYRNLTKLAETCLEAELPLALYGVGPDLAEISAAYLKRGAMLFPPVSYPHMLRELSRYDWGFVGTAEPHYYFNFVLPNKLFEYVAAGIPVICCRASTCAEFVKRHGLGVVIDSVEEIPEIYHQHGEYRNHVQQYRQFFCMEFQAAKILNLYNELLNGN